MSLRLVKGGAGDSTPAAPSANLMRGRCCHLLIELFSEAHPDREDFNMALREMYKVAYDLYHGTPPTEELPSELCSYEVVRRMVPLLMTRDIWGDLALEALVQLETSLQEVTTHLKKLERDSCR